VRNAFTGPQLLLVALVMTGGAVVWLWGSWELWRWFVKALLQ
jgi:hypothetical protein